MGENIMKYDMQELRVEDRVTESGTWSIIYHGFGTHMMIISRIDYQLNIFQRPHVSLIEVVSPYPDFE